jgi:hypothetical protein
MCVRVGRNALSKNLENVCIFGLKENDKKIHLLNCCVLRWKSITVAFKSTIKSFLKTDTLSLKK